MGGSSWEHDLRNGDDSGTDDSREEESGTALGLREEGVRMSEHTQTDLSRTGKFMYVIILQF